MTENHEEYFDLSLADLEFEVWALLEYRQSLEGWISRFKSEDEARTREQLKAHGAENDQVEVRATLDFHEQRVEIMPRLLRGSYIVATWAFFETAVVAIASKMRDKRKAQLWLHDIAGENFLARASKYFDQVLRTPLVRTNALREQLQVLGTLRNAIVHANSRIESLRADQKKPVQNLLDDPNSGVTDLDGYLSFSSGLAERLFVAVEATLEPLFRVATDSSIK